jgi:hypothetical protein
VDGGEHDNPVFASSGEGEPVPAPPDAPLDVESVQPPDVGSAVEPGEEQAPPVEPEPEGVGIILSRVDVLTQAIEEHPDAPVNYVLRGEALMDGGDQDLAAEDFQKALELAEAHAETANWGYLYRAVADRAREGLRRIRT